MMHVPHKDTLIRFAAVSDFSVPLHMRRDWCAAGLTRYLSTPELTPRGQDIVDTAKAIGYEPPLQVGDMLRSKVWTVVVVQLDPVQYVGWCDDMTNLHVFTEAFGGYVNGYAHPDMLTYCLNFFRKSGKAKPEPLPTMTCPTCKGRGREVISLSVGADPDVESEWTATCSRCHGEKTIPDLRSEAKGADYSTIPIGEVVFSPPPSLPQWRVDLTWHEGGDIRLVVDGVEGMPQWINHTLPLYDLAWMLADSHHAATWREGKLYVEGYEVHVQGNCACEITRVDVPSLGPSHAQVVGGTAAKALGFGSSESDYTAVTEQQRRETRSHTINVNGVKFTFSGVESGRTDSSVPNTPKPAQSKCPPRYSEATLAKARASSQLLVTPQGNIRLDFGKYARKLRAAAAIAEAGLDAEHRRALGVNDKPGPAPKAKRPNERSAAEVMDIIRKGGEQ